MDGFVIAHAMGWFCKTLIIRDFWMTNIMSVAFEFLEYSLEHQLPNFSECWWAWVSRLALLINCLNFHVPFFMIK